jgi:hypothetical protein
MTSHKLPPLFAILKRNGGYSALRMPVDQVRSALVGHGVLDIELSREQMEALHDILTAALGRRYNPASATS